MSLDPGSSAIAARYDAIAYAAVPHALTHPDRLATVATLLGMSPPAVAESRVLEVGCNDGANLVPMALALPAARFLGCDVSVSALDEGRRTIARLGLTNIMLVEEDLAKLSPAHGAFDYIIAHGVYSWVPAPIRDALFALAAERLAPNGVLFVSFNALPGCRVRQAAWEVLHRHVDRIEDPRARMEAARRIARVIAEAGKTSHDGDEALRAEFAAIAMRSDSALFHDDLALPNDPVYIADFVAHATGFGLAYLAEADLHTMSGAGLSIGARDLVAAQEPGAREQYLDFVRLRRFRQSLLRRSDATLDMSTHAARINAMHIAADASLLRAARAGKTGELASRLAPGIPGGGGATRKLLDTLLQRAPAATPVAAMREIVGEQGLARPLEALLTEAFVAGIVTLHVHPPALAVVGGAHPVANPLARIQAETRDEVAGLLHTRVRMPDANTRRLLTLLDGTRDRAALAAAMVGPPSGFDRRTARQFVDYALEQFGKLALLVA